MNEMFLEIPEKIENLQLPNPELLSYYQDLDQRTIWINYEIDGGVIDIIKKILKWNKEDKGKEKEERVPIRLLIFSPGGDLTSCLSLINIMELSETPIYTYSMGESSSAGLYLLLAGNKRFALKDTTAVLHKGSGAFQGVANQIDSSVSWYKKQLTGLKDFVLTHTQLDVKVYRRHQDEDWYLSSEDMLKYGFIHEVISDINTIIG